MRGLIAQLLVAELEAREQRGAQVRQKNIGALDQAVHDFATALGLEIERQALLVAIDDQEILVPVAHGQALQALHAAALVPALRPLDLDHLGTEIGQVLGAHRPLEPHRQIDDPNSFERPRHGSPPWRSGRRSPTRRGPTGREAHARSAVRAPPQAGRGERVSRSCRWGSPVS